MKQPTRFTNFSTVHRLFRRSLVTSVMISS